jgi:hypothetical protein
VTGGLGDTNVMHLPYDEAPTFCWVANGADEVPPRGAHARARGRRSAEAEHLGAMAERSSAGADVTVMTDEEVAAADGSRAPAQPARGRALSQRRLVMMALRPRRRGDLPRELLRRASAGRARSRARSHLRGAGARPHVEPRGVRRPPSAFPRSARRPRPTKSRSRSTPTVACASAASACCPGGDYGFPTSPHGTYAPRSRDLRRHPRVLTDETLVAATRHGGEIMGKPGELWCHFRWSSRGSARRGWRSARGHHAHAGSGRSSASS